MGSKSKPVSLKLNMLLNAIKGLMGVLFPLITFPYISRILGVDSLGKYSFSNSAVQYFIMFSALGINTYAIREGARIREDILDIERFSCQMFSINVISSIVSYIALMICLITVKKFHRYSDIMLILSLQIAFRTIGVEWLFSIFEDYLYITIRTILFQILSIFLLFAFVKGPDDLRLYAVITVISAVGSNLVSFIYARKKYCMIKFVKEIEWSKHIKQILILFAMALTISIYVSSDTIILGFLRDDYTVGIYSVSTKVYTVIKTLLSSVLVVSMPRLSFLLDGDRKQEIQALASDIYCTLLSIVVPTMVGIVVLRREIILAISSADYIRAESSLSLLCVALFFCMGAWFWGQCIMVPYKMDIDIFRITITSALINIVLNFVLIPRWGENAAAFTTVLAEGYSFIRCAQKGRRVVRPKGVVIVLCKVILGCAAIVALALLIRNSIKGLIPRVLTTSIGGILLYFLIQVILKNNVVTDLAASAKTRICFKKGK